VFSFDSAAFGALLVDGEPDIPKNLGSDKL
jgi:hypothetical protein